MILLQFNTYILAGMWMQIARGMRDNSRYSMAGVMMTVVTLVGNIVFIIAMQMRVDGLIISNILAAGAVFVFLEWALQIRKYIRFEDRNRELLREIAAYSIPLIPNVLSWWFMNVSDRFVINYFLGFEANGVYAVANKFPAFILVINSIFYLAWQESAITEYQSPDRDQFYTKMFQHFFRLQFTTIIGLLAFTKFLMSFMVNEKFASAWLYTPFLYFGAIFAAFSAFYGTGYQSAKETKGAFYTTIYGAVLNIGLNILLTPYIGIQGAALSTMLAFLVVWLIRIKGTQKYFVIRMNRWDLFSLPFISVIFIIFYYIGYGSLQPFFMAAAAGIFLWYNRNLLAPLFLRVKSWSKERMSFS